MAKARRRKTAGTRGLTLGVCLFLVAITWLVFGQTLGHEFVNFDDHVYVYENPVITGGLTLPGIIWAFTHSHARNWHPLTTISHMLDCQLFGLNAGGHHFTNVVLHTIAAVLLFLVLRDMTAVVPRLRDDAGRDQRSRLQSQGAIWRSAFVAALFAIHPLHVESVAWISERKDVLSGVFFMLTLGAYVRYARQPSAARYIMMSILFAVGLMSKPMLVTVPFVLLLLDYWPLGRAEIGEQRAMSRGQRVEGRGERSAAFAKATSAREVRRERSVVRGSLRRIRPSADQKSVVSRQRSVVRGLVFEKIPLLALSAASCLATVIAQRGTTGEMEPLPLAWRINNAVVSCVIYIWQMLWPARLAVFYPANQLPLWLIVFAFAFLIAVSAIAIGARRSHPYIFTGWFWYLGMLVPVIGVFQIGLQSHADRYTYLPQIGLYLLVTWAAAEIGKTLNAQLSTLNVQFSGIRWALSVGRWTARSRRLSEFSVLIVAMLAWRAWNQTKFWKNSETLWTHALAVTSNNDVAHNNLGLFFAERGQIDGAISQYESALKIRSGAEEARYNLSNALVHNNLGNALVQKDRLDDAIGHYEKALKLRPDYADGHFNLGSVLLREGRLDEAIGEWQKTLAIHPQDVEAHTTLGDALLRKSEFGQAITHYEAALGIAPHSISTLNNLAWALSTCPDASLRNGAKAIELAEKADQLSGGKNPTFIRTLAAAYAENGRFNDAIETAQRALQLATAQDNFALASKLEKDLDLYRTNVPLRDFGLTNAH